MLNKFIDQIRLPFRKEKELYLSIYHIIGILPHNLEYYKTALLHKSVARRNEKGRPINNERLEFLGDAILDAIVGDIVFQHFSGKREGFLTNTRSKIVQRDTLNRLAKDMGITRLILSNGRSASHNSYLGGNAFEALVGALYLDHGYNACKKFMQKQILGELINIDKVAYKEVNFKSKLLEWTQKHKVEIEFKPLNFGKDSDGNPTFSFQVILENIACGEGKGYSKKESQQEAAKETMQRIRKDAKFADKIFAAKKLRLQKEAEEKAKMETKNTTDEDLENNVILVEIEQNTTE
ncbi:ribonuclease III [Prevotella disiens]|mgnify:FL=1|uniref:Ribonuclease 3 n=3 Tax=Prevotella disiens TaxID=28130 RepID=A0A379DVE2_9BACT|nr:ribonuclease III [Prevotella disiens]EFL46695.1 ribonuclease III [Prevotella disiens FB035-09AN]ERJ77063.1 ribonuclease III [Prevotella disiens JCM 6334 = ATCC 29426]RGK99230.1 ribonuclease III [Prevotella disiens]SUB84453.1 Ribonuclease 3 [Prevotella disiens]